MDPLSVTAGVIAVLQATEAVISVCCDYRSAVQGSSWELPRVLEQVRSLRNVLRILEDLANEAETPGSDKEYRLPALKSLCETDVGDLSRCRAELRGLEEKLALPGWVGPMHSRRRGIAEALSWPLKKAETERVLASIERFKSAFNLAIMADQTSSILAIEDATQETRTAVSEVKSSVSSMKIDLNEKEIRQWFNATEPFTKLDQTLRDRHAGTGSWFTKRRLFLDWKKEPNSLLWLHGIPGCGKTVLCSTVIEIILKDCERTTTTGVGYFFFEFNDLEKQRHQTMLRSLIAQLSSQSKRPGALESLYFDCGGGSRQPTPSMLLTTLQTIVDGFNEVFIILDALDECTERDDLLTAIEELVAWNIPKVHILCTSRRERDIEESLTVFLDIKFMLCIQSALIKGDLRAYVKGRIRTDRKLKRWQNSDVQEEIETALVVKADGMFQWVKCQMDALGRCLSLSDLRKTLKTLPRDLDETYSRILRNIDDAGYSELVLKVLQWLAYSVRPMSLREVAEVIAIDVAGDPRYDAERRLEDPQDLLAMCSSLVTIGHGRYAESRYLVESSSSSRESEPSKKSAETLELESSSSSPAEEKFSGDNNSERPGGDVLETKTKVRFARLASPEYLTSDEIELKHAERVDIYSQRPREESDEEERERRLLESETKIQFAHFSVREYLVSDRIYLGPANKYGIDQVRANTFIAEACLSYVLHFHQIPDALEDDTMAICPLATYATHHLAHHAQEAEESGCIIPLTKELFVNEVDILFDWIQLCGLEPPDCADVCGKPLPLLYAAELNLPKLAHEFILDGVDVNARSHTTGSTALIRASSAGHEQIVQLLLKHGAQLDTLDEQGRTALIAASNEGCEQVVRLLLEKGAEVGAKTYIGDTALSRATMSSHAQIVRLLLDEGAIISKSHGADALWYACVEGHVEIVRILLAHGVDVNAETDMGFSRETALIGALIGDSNTVLEVLLDNGADVNIPKNAIEPSRLHWLEETLRERGATLPKEWE